MYEPLPADDELVSCFEVALMASCEASSQSHSVEADRHPANRPGCTKTAVMRVLFGIMQALYEGDVTVLAQLNSPASVDTADHSISLLCPRLLSFCLDGPWISI